MGVYLPEPFIRKGEPIRADALCDLARATQRRSLSIGQYQSASLDLQRKLKGGGGAPLEFIFGHTTNLGTVATTYALDDAGVVMFQERDDAGDPVGAPFQVKIRYADVIDPNTPGYVYKNKLFVPIGLNFGCNTLTPPA